ncbi:hypothetical protein Dvina_23405 [Dactylosporangium vinaceum]|uniref:Uncharacterized protein n=1 Tax=Dactylosporangium vinaceum TaxID=53362 RepID=A0ABV5MDD8_9ACTN|nr:hypothetical protein [Dactylosporangium vinaceum]UAC00734.1 hypothetical protein Dvina_23405 [Dactylosporangium vinaceum]
MRHRGELQRLEVDEVVDGQRRGEQAVDVAVQLRQVGVHRGRFRRACLDVHACGDPLRLGPFGGAGPRRGGGRPLEAHPGPLHLPLRRGLGADDGRHLLAPPSLRLLGLMVELREEAASCHRTSR